MEIVEKDLGKYLKVGAQTVAGKMEAKISIDAAALLDDAAANIKGKIPGNLEDGIVDTVVAELKKDLLGVVAPSA